jgi:hypothetical protein
MASKKTRKVRAAAKARAKARKSPKAATTQPLPKSVVSQNRSEGLRLFKLAGRPTKEQFMHLPTICNTTIEPGPKI